MDNKGQLIKDVFEKTSVTISPHSGFIGDVELVANREKLLESVNALKKTNNVLGILEGVYFIPNGYSRNKRFYPKELWEKVIREVKPRLSSMGVLGTLEHPEKQEDSHPKHASHVLKDLWIDEKSRLGFGKSYLLNTPMGSLVYVLGTALDEEGKPLVPLFMSSRGYGKTIGYNQEGYEIVDPSSYYLETFDVVLNPGFIEAKTSLKEVAESISSVIPEVESMEFDEERLNFFIKGIFREEAEEVGIKEYEPIPVHEVGFVPEGVLSHPTVPIYESTQEKEETKEKDVASVFDTLVLDREGLSEEELLAFVKTVERTEYWKNGEDIEKTERGSEDVTLRGTKHDQESLLLIKDLVSEIEEIKREISSIKVRLVSEKYGISKEESRKILESSSWDIDLVDKKMGKKRHSKTEKKKKINEDLSNIYIEEGKKSDTEEDFGKKILNSILERFER